MLLTACAARVCEATALLRRCRATVRAALAALSCFFSLVTRAAFPLATAAFSFLVSELTFKVAALALPVAFTTAARAVASRDLAVVQAADSRPVRGLLVAVPGTKPARVATTRTEIGLPTSDLLTV